MTLFEERPLCDYDAFPGWWCSRLKDHDGPCALRPITPPRHRSRRKRDQLRRWWHNLQCALTEHKWEHQGRDTWTVICSRCGERYYLAEAR